MNTVAISGTIVNTLDDYFSDSDTVLATDVAGQIMYLCNGDDLLIEVNSPGGDTQGASRIVSAIRAWRRGNADRHLTVEIHGMAASAAANILTQIPRENCEVIAHSDSLIMFHSCSMCCCAGPEGLRDIAEWGDRYNASVKEWLKANTTLDSNSIDDAFSEGRMMWLSASEAMECGIIDKIVDTPAIQLEESDSVPEGTLSAVAKFSADMVSAFKKHKKEVVEMTTKQKAEEPEKTEPGLPPEPEKTEPKKEELEPSVTSPAPVLEDECEEEPKKDVASADELQKKDDEIAALKAEVKELKKELEQANGAVARLTPGLRHTHEVQKAQFASWIEAVRSLDGLPQKQWDDAYIRMKSEHKELYDAYVASAK